MFSKIDADGDGELDEEEFVRCNMGLAMMMTYCRGCLKDHDFVLLLSTAGVDPEDLLEEEDDEEE